LTVSAGQVDRWRLVNTSSARYVRLSIGGTPFRILGTGGGLVETPVVATEALLVPGDRLDIAVGPFDEGTPFPLNRWRTIAASVRDRRKFSPRCESDHSRPRAL